MTRSRTFEVPDVGTVVIRLTSDRMPELHREVDGKPDPRPVRYDCRMAGEQQFNNLVSHYMERGRDISSAERAVIFGTDEIDEDNAAADEAARFHN